MAGATNSARRDEATDASQFLCRLGYAVLGLAGPAGVVLHPVAIFIIFPIGVALLSFAAALDPPGHFQGRLDSAFSSPPVYLGLAWLAWAVLSLAWTPFPGAGAEKLAEYAVWAVGLGLALGLTRDHARATDLYVFPIGLLLAMAAILVAWIALRHGAPVGYERIDEGGVALAALLFPVMGALAARARNGYARILMVVAFVYVFVIGSPATMMALLVGLAAMSFALSDMKRTARDLSLFAAGVIALAPLIVLIVAPLARLMLNAKLPSLPAPYPSLAFAFHVVQFDWVRLITGHGVSTVVNGINAGALPPETPRNAVFQIWYEFGIVGAWLAAAGVWAAFRAMGKFPPRLAPYLTAAFACNLALGATRVDFGDMTWVTMLAIALIASDVAARSQYRTTRPSAEGLAHF